MFTDKTMMFLKKIPAIAAGVIMTVSLAYGVNDDMDNIFDEEKWKESVQSTDASGFYAPHFKDGEYFNPWMPMERKGFFTVLKWHYFSERQKYSEAEENFIPEVKHLTAGYINSHDNFFTWAGHASVLVKYSGHVILVDPVFGEIPFVKKRRTPSALDYGEAASLEGRVTVLITHNHYDHLDKKSILSLPDDTGFIVPAGLSSEIREIRGSDADVREMVWWDETSCGGIRITFLPSQHWSKRAFRKANSSLWGSYLLDTGTKKIFICGDTGYSLIYHEISKKFHGIDYAFISAGAFHPRWFMHYAHQDDSEAIMGYTELGAKNMIPFHWGAFRLGDEPEGYPALQIKKRLPDSLIMNAGDIIGLPNR